MPIHLKIAEKIYKELMSKKSFTDEPLDYLNLLIKYIRKEIKGTNLKLLYNFIEFHEEFKKPVSKEGGSIDVSLIPSYKQQDEFLLWFASFIEKVTTGGRKYLPPIVEDIPADFTISSDPEELLELADVKKVEEQTKSKEYQILNEFKSYFESNEFKKII